MVSRASVGPGTTADPAGAGGPHAEPVLGVLFVHGFGGQKRGGTLLRFGEPIVRWLNRWIDDATAHDPERCAVPFVETVAVRVRGRDPDAPPHAWLTARAGRAGSPPPTGRWLLAESWWATDFSPASFSEVAKWGIGIGPWIFGRYLEKRRSWPYIRNLQYFVAIALGPLLQLAMLALLVLAIVPFMRRFVGAIMLKLADSFGDAYVLVSSPLRFDAMATKVRDDLAWLAAQGCTAIAVVAHSQGTAVAHRALRTLPTDRPPVQRIKLFVTFGTALDKLHRLLQVVPEGRRVVTSGIISSLGVGLAVLGPALLAWQADSLVWTLGPVLVALGVVIFYVGVLLPVRGVEELAETDLWPHAVADGRVRWHDYAALADPVPDGKLPFTGVPTGQTAALCLDPTVLKRSCEIRNRDAIAHDHSVYQENNEQFLAPLVRALTDVAGWDLGFTADESTRLEAAFAGRVGRVRSLTDAYLLAVATVLIVVVVLAFSSSLRDVGRPIAEGASALTERMAIPLEGAFSGIAKHRIVRWLCGIACVVALAAVWYRVVVFLGWRNWDQREADNLFSHGTRQGRPLDWIAFRVTKWLTPVAIAGGVAVWLWYW